MAEMAGGLARDRYRIPRQRPGTEPWTAERIAALRSRLGLSQSAFAAEIGVRQQTVSEWETGRYQPRGATARMLAILAEDAPTYDARTRRR